MKKKIRFPHGKKTHFIHVLTGDVDNSVVAVLKVEEDGRPESIERFCEGIDIERKIDPLKDEEDYDDFAGRLVEKMVKRGWKAERHKAFGVTNLDVELD